VVAGSGLAAAGASAGPLTAAIALLGAGPSGGGTVVAGAVVITAEGAMVVIGLSEAAYGLALLAYIKGDPLPARGMLGENGPQFRSKTVWEGERGRIDVENPAPGRRAGQIHFQEWGRNGQKWLFDPETGSFLPERGTGVLPPGWLTKMLQDPGFAAGISKGMKYLGEPW